MSLAQRMWLARGRHGHFTSVVVLLSLVLSSGSPSTGELKVQRLRVPVANQQIVGEQHVIVGTTGPASITKQSQESPLWRRWGMPRWANWRGKSKQILEVLNPVDEFRDDLHARVLHLAQEETGLSLSSNEGGWQSRHDLHTRALDEVERLKKVITQTAVTYAARSFEEAQEPPHVIVDALWANVLGPGSANTWHTHASRRRRTDFSKISGVYYVSVGNSPGAKLLLRDAFGDNHGAIENTTLVQVAPTPGKMVLFPSWMSHATTTMELTNHATESDIPRISIAFNLYTRWFSSAVERGVFIGDISNLQSLIRTSMEANAIDNKGMRPVCLAAEAGHLEVLEFLVSQRSEVSLPSAEGKLPLQIALQEGHTALVEALIHYRADMAGDISDTKGQPLHLAAKMGHLAIVHSLLGLRADVHSKTVGRNMEPLHFADSPAVGRRLLVARASLEVSDGHGMRTLHYAAFLGNLDMVKFLLAERADTGSQIAHNASSINNDRPVHQAANAGHLSVVKFLVAHRHSSICDTGAHGRLPLDAAGSKVAQWLRVHGGECRKNDTKVLLLSDKRTEAHPSSLIQV